MKYAIALRYSIIFCWACPLFFLHVYVYFLLTNRKGASFLAPKKQTLFSSSQDSVASLLLASSFQTCSQKSHKCFILMKCRCSSSSFHFDVSPLASTRVLFFFVLTREHRFYLSKTLSRASSFWCTPVISYKYS